MGITASSQQITRKKLGSSGVEIPSIGFGTWRYTGGVRPLLTAIESGARFIDTAELYGTEEVVGSAIKGRRAEVFVATKVRPAHFRRHDVVRAAEASLRRLGTDYIDLYQLHWPNYNIPIEETMAAMEELAEAGKIRFIGVSNFSTGELKSAQACLRKHRIVSNQLRYSLVERTIENGLLQYCQNQGMTVVAYSPLGANFQSFRKNDSRGLLSSIAAKYHRAEAQLALNWLLEKDSVVVIPKASTPQHVVEDCGACGWRLADADYQALTDGVQFRRRGVFEILARRCIKRTLQRFGKVL